MIADPNRGVSDYRARLRREGPSSLRTARFELEPICRAHAPLLFGVLSDPALHEYTGGVPPATVEALALRFSVWEKCQSPDGSELWLNWSICEREHGERVGYVQATVAQDHVDFAWVIGIAWQRRGYASEAAQAVKEWIAGLGATNFRACIKPEHAASQRVAERLGLRRSGAWIDGEEVWAVRGARP